MKDSLRVIAFATVLAVACAGLLTAASELLGPLQKANRQAEKWRNVFDVLDVPYQEGESARQLLRRIRTPDNPDGKVAQRAVGELTIYEHDHPEAGRLRAVQFEGSGLWAPVKGLICLRADLKTVYRISFYEHEETPGLGGEISTPGFRGRFAGKTIALPGGEPGIRITRTKARAANEVDGISGATMTCDKVAAMLKKISEAIAAHRNEILREDGNG